MLLSMEKNSKKRGPKNGIEIKKIKEQVQEK